MLQTEKIRCAPGRRRLALSLIAQQVNAREFAGLPEGVSPGQALAAFKRAAPALGLSHLRDLVDQLMAFSRPQDWEEGSRPIVWPSNAALSEQLGISERHVRRLLARLLAAGILLPLDSPEGKRWGKRDASGRILEAYGFDLSPLALRFQEFRALAEAAAAERRAKSTLRRRLTIARLAIQQLAEIAFEEDVPGRDWSAWLSEALALAAPAAGQSQSLEALQVVVEELERWRQAGEETLRRVFTGDKSGDRSAAADPEVLPHTTTNKRPADQSATRNTDSGKESTRQEPEGPRPGRGTTAASNVPHGAPEPAEESDEPAAPTPALLLRAVPLLREQLLTPPSTWAEIVIAADRLRRSLGISQAAWIDACQTLGRYRAATAVAIIAAKQTEIRRPGGYLRGMVARGRRGELRLTASLHGLAERAREVPPCCSGRD